MFGQSTSRNPASRVTELMRNIRALENKVRSLDTGAASRASADVADSVGTALEDITDRVRNGAGYAADEAARLGRRASAAGRESYAYLKSEVDAHPLVVLGVAAGIGILIGASLYRRSTSSPAEPKQRRRTKRKARK